GVIDWLMKYTPGRKARHEYREFTTKRVGGQVMRPKLLQAVKQESKLSSKQGSKDELQKGREEAASEWTPEDAILIEKLAGHGIDETRAVRLVESDRAECELWAAAWPHQNQKGMENPPAVLISFIETKRRPLPKGYKDAIAHEELRKGREEKQARE